MARWFCPYCGQENNGNFCVACGTAMPQPVGQTTESKQATDSPQPSPFVVTFETGRHYKVHKSYVWLGPVVAVLAVAVIALANSMPGIMQGISALRDSDVHIPVLPLWWASSSASLLSTVLSWPFTLLRTRICRTCLTNASSASIPESSPSVVRTFPMHAYNRSTTVQRLFSDWLACARCRSILLVVRRTRRCAFRS